MPPTSRRRRRPAQDPSAAARRPPGKFSPRRHKLLLFIYVVTLAVGWREYRLSTQGPPVDLFNAPGPNFTATLQEINAGDVDAEFMAALRDRMLNGDGQAAAERLRRLIDAGIKHNAGLFHSYAQQLIDNTAPPDEVTRAINLWRENFPDAKTPFRISLTDWTGGGNPFMAADGVSLRVSWVESLQLQPGEPPELELQVREGERVEFAELLEALEKAGFQCGWGAGG